MKCEKCGSENVADGILLTNTGTLIFSTKGLEKNPPLTKTIRKSSSVVIASACKDCGNVFSIRIENPENIDHTK